MNNKDIDKKLALHHKWLNDKKGVPAIFENLDLKNFDFFNKNLKSVVFVDCNLANANFNRTNCYFTQFLRCDLTKANFTFTQCFNTCFEFSNITDILFAGTNLEQAIIHKCKGVTRVLIEKARRFNVLFA